MEQSGATQRTLARVYTARQLLEGAGVLLRRGISNTEAEHFDPFLMFDDFSSDIPEHYLAGFPWHPHRGMETVTYILDGVVRHKDSLGNEGTIENGAVQWMTAGSGIIHEEMPESVHGIRGFQLWVNLPREQKMTKPTYQDLRGEVIPEIVFEGAQVRVIAGTIADVAGPLAAIAGNPLYIDVTMVPNARVTIPVIDGHTAFAYVIEGALGVASSETLYPGGSVLLLSHEGDEVVLTAGPRGARFLFVAGQPLNEPIAWQGPIVMNTDAELRTAFRDLAEGTFIRT